MARLRVVWDKRVLVTATALATVWLLGNLILGTSPRRVLEMVLPIAAVALLAGFLWSQFWPPRRGRGQD